MEKTIKAIRTKDKRIDFPFNIKVETEKNAYIQIIDKLVKEYNALKEENDNLSLDLRHRYNRGNLWNIY